MLVFQTGRVWSGRTYVSVRECEGWEVVEWQDVMVKSPSVSDVMVKSPSVSDGNEAVHGKM